MSSTSSRHHLFFLFSSHTHTGFFFFSNRHVVQNSQVWTTFCLVLWFIYFPYIYVDANTSSRVSFYFSSFYVYPHSKRKMNVNVSLVVCRLYQCYVTHYHLYTNTPFFSFLVHPHSKRNKLMSISVHSSH